MTHSSITLFWYVLSVLFGLYVLAGLWLTLVVVRQEMKGEPLWLYAGCIVTLPGIVSVQALRAVWAARRASRAGRRRLRNQLRDQLPGALLVAGILLLYTFFFAALQQ